MTTQLALFDCGPRVLVDDETGRIAYYPNVFDPGEAMQLFHWLLDNAPWSSETMWMYDKMVDVPRLVARFAGDNLPPPLEGARERVAEFLGERFTSVGLNYYRDGRDSVAWHNDHLEDLPPQPTIALLSLGATRRMQVRTKRRPRIVHSVDLDAGSLFVMSGRSQEFWEHTIAKSPRPTDARISVAFRPRFLGNVSQHEQPQD
ncbi:MAG: alpha-ketoglutarate-dependent dioxygenase AlkB [Candidatus Eremiobacteraeota bacterium]|nr:alpha-ketoglutarate-dependent dioxygenase AlkB [Candidatus Eremiobacteraeota bacterium]